MMRMSAFGVVAIGLFLSVSAYADKTQSQLTALDYETLSALPYNVQIDYLNAVRDVLIEIDSDKTQSPSALNWMLDQILCSANAGEGDGPFCINLGVVQPHDDCPKEEGQFHNFSTTDYFNKIGLGIAGCSGGSMPCSPFFGFQKDGSPFCSVPNSTRVCEQESSSAKDRIELADVIKKCASKEKFDQPQISCQNLPKFYKTQNEIAYKYCKETSQLACGRLRRQADKVAQEVNKLDAAKICSFLGDANINNPVTSPKSACSPAPIAPLKASSSTPVVKAPAPQPVAPVPVAVKAPHTDTDAPQMTSPPALPMIDCKVKVSVSDNEDQDIDELWKNAYKSTNLKSSDPKDTCVQYKTKDNTIFTLNGNALNVITGGVVQRPSPDGKSQAPNPISFNRDVVVVMQGLSKLFEAENSNSKISIDPAKLLQYYLPSKPIVQADPKDAIVDNGKSYPTFEYETQSGTVIRYAEENKNGAIAVQFQMDGEKDPRVWNYRI